MKACVPGNNSLAEHFKSGETCPGSRPDWEPQALVTCLIQGISANQAKLDVPHLALPGRSSMPYRYTYLLVLGLLIAAPAQAAEKLPAGVACLLEDNAAELLPKLTNPWGDPGE